MTATIEYWVRRIRNTKYSICCIYTEDKRQKEVLWAEKEKDINYIRKTDRYIRNVRTGHAREKKKEKDKVKKKKQSNRRSTLEGPFSGPADPESKKAMRWYKQLRWLVFMKMLWFSIWSSLYQFNLIGWIFILFA